MIGLILLLLSVLTPAASTGLETIPSPEAVQEACVANKRFSFSGQVQVKCENGSCRWVSKAGVVYASNEAEARIAAAAAVQAEGSRHGTVISGTVSVEIRLNQPSVFRGGDWNREDLNLWTDHGYDGQLEQPGNGDTVKWLRRQGLTSTYINLTHDNQLTSLQVPHGIKVTLYTDRDCDGNSLSFGPNTQVWNLDKYMLGTGNWNDCVSSVRIQLVGR